MPTYKILLPPLYTDQPIEGDTVELTAEAAAPLVKTGTLELLKPAIPTEGKTIPAEVKDAKPTDKLKAPKADS